MTRVNTDATNSNRQVQILEKSEQCRSTLNLLEDDHAFGNVEDKTQLLFTIPGNREVLAIEVWTSHIQIPPSKKGPAKVLHKNSIYAFHLSKKMQHGIEIIRYEDKKTKKTRRVYELLIQSEDSKQSSDEAKAYVTKLREWLWEVPLGSQHLMDQWWKRYLIVVNPYSGYQKGRRRFFRVVQPIMEECRIKYDVIFTERSMQGMEIGKTTPASKYDGIIGMSGDGLINEILNGMINRPDKEAALKTPLGAIANGTSNCFAAEVMDGHGDISIENALVNSTLHVIKGIPKKFNLTRIQLGSSQNIHHCFQLTTWGLMANLEFESIPLRVLGPLRYTVYTMKHLILKKKFIGDVWINLVPSNQWNAKYKSYFDNCSHRSRDKEFLTSVQPTLSQPSSSSQPIGIDNELPENSTWVKLPTTEIFLLSFANMRRWGLDFIGCKFLEHDDSFGYIVIARHPLKRLDILRAFLLLEKGDHQNLDLVEIYCARGLRVKPDTQNSAVTYIALDGEKQASQNFQIDVIPDAVNMLF